MARVGFVQRGFHDKDDPRNYLKPQWIEPFIPNTFEGFFYGDGKFAYDFTSTWQRLQFDVNINWDDGVSSEAISLSDSILVGWAYTAIPPDESSIDCQSSISWSFSGSNGAIQPSDFTITIKLGEYKVTNKVFEFGVSGGFSAFAQPSPTVSFGFPFTGPPSGVTCTILGNEVPMYDVVGSATGSVIVTNASTEGYWTYDNHAVDENGQPKGPPDGPIFDADTGEQLITPIPRGL